MSEIGESVWAFITTWNPRSQPTSVELNAKAEAELQKIIRERGFVFYEGDGIPDDPGWAPERSIFIAGISREEAVRVGVQFDQNAIVVGKRGEATELVFCDSWVC